MRLICTNVKPFPAERQNTSGEKGDDSCILPCWDYGSYKRIFACMYVCMYVYLLLASYFANETRLLEQGAARLKDYLDKVGSCRSLQTRGISTMLCRLNCLSIVLADSSQVQIQIQPPENSK